MTHLQKLSAEIEQQYFDSYHRMPRWIVAAPGWVNLIGEHVDYNNGFVMPMAIDRYSVMAADFPPDHRRIIQIRDVTGPEPTIVDLSAPITPAPPKWGNYLRGVIANCLRKGLDPGGLDVLLHSTVPIGSGLSSSAALEVCMATLVEAASGKRIDPVEKALLCQKAEHDFAGVPCGIMDQFISAMGRNGHLLLIDCRSHQTQLVPMDDPAISVVIVNTNVKHELVSGEYAQRRAQCEAAIKILGAPSLRDVTSDSLNNARGKMDDVIFRRARHVIGEIERTVHAAEGIRTSNWTAVGQLMYASHRSLRDDYEVSCDELDMVVNIAERIGIKGGVYGCRMTGGGFGGCAIALVKTEKVNAIVGQIEAEYKAKTGIEATIFSSRPAEGATVLSV